MGAYSPGGPLARQRLAGEERSRAIIEATLEVFAREGCSGATTRQISKAAGVSEALVFKYFPTKKSLYSAILRAKIAESERTLPLDRSLEMLDDETFFLRIAMSLMKRVEADQTFLRLLLHSALEGHELFRAFYKERVERVLSVIESRVRTILKRRTERSRIDPALAARSFNGMITAAMLSRHIFRDRMVRSVPIEKHARLLVSVFLRGLDSERKP